MKQKKKMTTIFIPKYLVCLKGFTIFGLPKTKIQTSGLMKNLPVYLIAVTPFLICCIETSAQEETPVSDTLRKDALNLYMEVSDHVRREISYVNYVRDIKDADLYVISTSQPTGAGGREHTYFLTGQKRYSGMIDTLRFTVFPDDTQDVIRRKEIQTLQMGLMRYVAKTPLALYLSISFDQPVSQIITTDKWNNWVFRSSLNGFVNGQKTYNMSYLNGRFSANRITEKSKLETNLNYSRGEDNFIIDESTIKSVNHSRGFSGLYVHGINDHWSVGGSANMSSSSYRNQKVRFSVLSGIEYNIFPYSESTSRQFRMLYQIGPEYNNYVDTTIYGKTEETLALHSFSAAYQVVQKWGSVNISSTWRNYLHDFSKRNLSLSGFLSLRVFKGLSFNMGGGASLIHDQLSLIKGGATTEEILLRRKELETQYSYFTSIGLSYTFGSIYSNVVNPRFGSSSGGSTMVISF